METTRDLREGNLEYLGWKPVCNVLKSDTGLKKMAAVSI